MAAEFPDFLHEPADTVAQLLLGCELERETRDGPIRVRIVETEAYDQDDEASHAYRGPTRRNAAMFGASGHLYVYFTYGMHHCCNVVCDAPGYGAGALIRAAEPVSGVELIEHGHRDTAAIATNGPAKLCRALAIDRELSGHDLRSGPLRLIAGRLTEHEAVTQTTRIGISKAAERPRRFYITGNRYVSRRSRR